MKNSEKKEQDDRLPLTDNEAIKSTEEVSQDKKQKDDRSGEDILDFLNYPSGEDMLNPSSGLERVDINVENITRAGNISGEAGLADPGIPSPNDMEKPLDVDDDEDDLGIVPGTDADVTKEDLLLLGAKDQDMDLGEDEDLQNKGFALDQTGDDLDVPGDELDDADEEIGEEDEENNYYSLGGDNKDSLDEDNSANEV